MTLQEIEKDFADMSERNFRAKQVYQWLVKSVNNFDDMKNIPQIFRDTLKEKYFIPHLKIKKKRISSDGTIKYLFELFDGELIESVLMKYKHGYSICISTQAGCKMGCAFCATGKNGFKRNLSSSEILSSSIFLISLTILS